MTTVGIDLISFYTPQYFLDLKTLAEKRGVDFNKFYTGLGQEKMAIPPPDEDIVTMAASAARPILDQTDPSEIELLLFGTESGVDQSKAAAMFAHGLLKLPTRCRGFEVKEACYAGTAALQLAIPWALRNPGKKALILASDIARYDLNSPGEPTQGAGAIAMLVGVNPRIMAIEPESGLYASDVMDFWRPNYRDEAVVDGKYSMRVYIAALEEAWRQYHALSGRGLADMARFCYHLPFTKMAEKAHVRLAKTAGVANLSPEDMEHQMGESLHYNRITGNTYAASLYEGLCSLLDNCTKDLAGKRVALFSYGSGCMGEFFSGILQADYRKHLYSAAHKNLLDNRTELTYQQYEDVFQLGCPTDGGDHTFAQYRTGVYRMKGISQHKRLYEALT
ncbi:MAG: Polyketide biosynthesis 3-hydroxy-3-methylglutaryl-ACP synthase PksG [Verrucomicrobia bacterium ADurb.Bin345]|nr:MAG: Polyketide biosynthesis 3-hydroxy-3-methylglutaryl-ACP synthase PksG [Verrucomicrobia bacterium ADurb.Bin345]